MEIIFEIIKLIALNTLAIFTFNLSGKLIKNWLFQSKKDKPFFNFFLESLIGFVALTSIYAIYKSKGATINLFAVLIIIVYGFIYRKNKFTFSKNRLKLNYIVLFYTFVVASIITVLSIFYQYKGNIDEDVAFYTNIAQELGFTGKENIYHYFNHVIDLNGTAPYHYIELWLGALFFKLKWFGLSNAIIFRYGVYSTLRALIVIGFLGLIETIKKINFIDVLISILLILFNSLFITEFFQSSWALQTSMWLRPNLIIYYLFLLPPFTFIVYKQYKEALFTILLLPIVAGPTAPALLTAMCIGLLSLIFINRKNKPTVQLYFKFFIATVALATGILLFYKITGAANKVFKPRFSNVNEIINYSLSIWKAIVFLIITLPLKALSIIALTLALLFLNFRTNVVSIIKNHTIIIIFALLLAFCGIFIFQLTTFIDNTYQFPYIGYVACYIVSVFLFYYIINDSIINIKNKIGILISLVFISTNLYLIKNDLKMDIGSNSLAELNLKRKSLSASYISELGHLVGHKKEMKAGFIFGPSEIMELAGTRQSLTYQLGSYTYYLNSNIRFFPLTNPTALYYNMDTSSIYYQKSKVFNDLLPFYSVAYAKNYDSVLTSYLMQNKYDFIIATKSFDKKIIPNVLIKKYCKDEKSGHQLIVLGK